MSGSRKQRDLVRTKLAVPWHKLTEHVRRRRALKRTPKPAADLAAAAAHAARPLARLVERTFAAQASSLAEILAPRPLPAALALATGIALGEVFGMAIAVSAMAIALLLSNLGRSPVRVMSADAGGEPTSRTLRGSLALLLVIVAVGAGVERWRGVDKPGEGDERVATSALEHRGVVLRPAQERKDGRFAVDVALAPDGEVVRVLTPRSVADRDAASARSHPRPAPGDELLLTGKLRAPRGARNPGSVDRAAMVRADGVELEMSAETLEITGRSTRLWLSMWRGLDALSFRWSSRIAGTSDNAADATAPTADLASNTTAATAHRPDATANTVAANARRADTTASTAGATAHRPDVTEDTVGATSDRAAEPSVTAAPISSTAVAASDTADLPSDGSNTPADTASPSSETADHPSDRTTTAAVAPGEDRFAVARAILRGVVLGIRGDIPPSVDDRWRAVGIYHVLSVSGLHLAVVALFVFTGLRRLLAAFGSRIEPAALALGPALIIATAYTLLTGAQVATLRALLVAALWMLGHALRRPLRLVDALGVTAIALLLWSPAQLEQPSFQLSFAAALGLARHRGATLDPALSLLRRSLSALARGATTSAWIVLITAPITAYHFHQVQPGGVVGNLVLTPLVELAALPLGLIGLLAGELSSFLGAALLTAAAAAVALADWLAAHLQPWCPVGTVAIAAPLTAVLLWAGTTALCGRRRPGAIDAAAWCGLCALWLAAPLAAPDGLRAVFLDVGQGDAALVETASETWLIDAGGAPNAPTPEAAAAPGRAIPRYLELSRRRHIDVAVISHPHPDHYLGLLALEGEVTIGELWLPPGFSGEQRGDYATGLPSFSSIVEKLRRAGTLVREPPSGGRWTRDGAHLMMIAPHYRESASSEERLAADPVRSVNDNSAVVTVQYAGRQILFAGDLELEGEEALVASHPRAMLRSDVIKVPHHGSRTSSTSELIAAVTAPLGPSEPGPIAIISCGASNRFGFPAPEVVERWEAAGAQVLRTDQGGAVIVEVGRDGNIEARRH